VEWPKVARVTYLLVVSLLALTAQIEVWTGDAAAGGRLLHSVLALCFTVPLVWARRFPLPVLMVVIGCTTADYLLDGGYGQAWFVLLLAVYALGRNAGSRSSAVGMTLVACALLAVDLPRLRDGAPLDEVVPGWFVVGGTWGLARWLRSRRDVHQKLLDHNAALERDREEATRAAVTHERARIATELHDLVAHSMAVIVLQAQAGSRVLGTDDEAAAGAFRSIESVGRQGMTELRRLLEVLLVDPEADDLSGRPSLQRLDELMERLRETGLPVDLEVHGQARPVAAGLDLSAYRIVQEALTNVLKHAGLVPVVVHVRHGADLVELEVHNEPGRVATSNGRVGHGLIGMRERAALYGGRLTAGPTADGGFRVHAVLPTGSDG
jgi:signal transduction histidine kinase